MLRSRLRFLLLAALGAAVAACGGAAQGVAVAISPKETQVSPLGTSAFNAVVTGTANLAVNWAVSEGNGAGTVTTGGLYTAPSTTGTYHVVATSVADGSKSATATVTVTAQGSSGWTNVTPKGVSLDPNYAGCGNCNYGAQDVLVDPARPSDLYAFFCYQGVWKSTDYGQKWTKVNTGTNSSYIDSGRPWTAAIDSNKNRDPNTQPALWTVAGYGNKLGVYKSTDGGVNWTHHTVGNSNAIAIANGNTAAGDDVYSLDVDPNDSAHLIAGFHGYPGVSESFDGGVNWHSVQVPKGMGTSLYVFFVDTGSSASTRTTWLTQAQANNNSEGIWRTTDAGSSWRQTSTLEHPHGNAQFFMAGGNVVYAAGYDGEAGVYKSTDGGATWTKGSGAPSESGVVGTPSRLYAMNGGATQGQNNVSNVLSARSDGVVWSAWNPTAPFSNGAKRAAVTYDGTHYIIVSGNWLAGLWRYVE